ncbi:MAG: rhamnulokinase [Verrucomicrobia bacterium]|nr:rhamnulokinase [Verrucomicrobiota bacterium]
MSTYHYIACDLGAESGRVMLGTLANGKLTLEEVHRFPNNGITVAGTLRWDALRIYDELKTGLRKIAQSGVKPNSVSTDSWGVDYVWLRGNEPMLTLPYAYRDPRTDDGYKRAFAVVKREEIFAETGIQFMTLNTLYQLHADVKFRPWVLKTADGFLTIGDYFNYLFSGKRVIEQSFASTTQLYNPKLRKWSVKLQKKLGIPAKLFPKIVKSGTVLGALLPGVAKETGLKGVKVVATCSHDTGAAVAAVPAQGSGWAYLSSGTWSLLGIEAREPIINEKSLEYNWTNEVGYGHTIRFLKNIVGLWVVQECKRTWANEGTEYNYDQITRIAAEAQPLKCLINPNAARFLKPDDMPSKVAAYCRETGQPVPQTHGEIVRCALESLALVYRKTLADASAITGQPITRLHIVGGGTKNALLNQFAANATGLTILTGPIEATAIGNILIQAIALKHLKSLDELRAVVRDSFPIQTYEPQDSDVWQAAYARFQKLTLLK